jgi:hypothetical protein
MMNYTKRLRGHTDWVHHHRTWVRRNKIVYSNKERGIRTKEEKNPQLGTIVGDLSVLQGYHQGR